MADLNFEGLSRLLLSQSRELLIQWLPGGRVLGKEYMCGSLRGEKGDSCRVNINTGRWSDFATGDKGGDLISLYAAIHGQGQGDAFKDLAQQHNFEQGGVMEKTSSKTTNNLHKTPEPETDIIQPPLNIQINDSQFTHREYGTPTSVWKYRNFNGDLLFCIARYDTPKGKQILPWTWSKRGHWNVKGWPAPRPLYGLELLNDRPTYKVMVVEGEKAADAARELCGHVYNVICWPNGAQALSKADWAPLVEKEVILWPDNDPAGMKAMEDLANMLLFQRCKVKVINPDGQPDGWDAADALEEGWDWDKLKEWAKPRAKEVEKAKNVIEAEKQQVNVYNQTLNVNMTEDEGEVLMSHVEIWDQCNLVITRTSGIPVVNYDNAVRVLHKWPPTMGLVWYDEFHDRIFTKYGTGKIREWTDNDDAELAVYFQHDLGMQKMSKEVIKNAVTMTAKRNTKNEVKEWFDGLKHDGQDRLSTFFARYFGAEDNVYTRQAGLNFWVGMVARVFLPGCKNDHMIVLEGRQGIGKSRSMEIIGGDWYAEASESVQSKDFYQVLKGKILIEIAELDSFGKADVTRIKQTISCPKDRYRAPYEARPQDHPRRSIFVGTTNEGEYLRDSTGGRRFWPIACGGIDLKALDEDRAQLFAQAVLQFKQGDDWYRMPVDETLAEQEHRLQRDEWENVIGEWIRFKNEVTGAEVATECLKIDIGRFDKLIQMRVAKILRRLGWIRNRVWKDQKTQIVWTPPV